MLFNVHRPKLQIYFKEKRTYLFLPPKLLYINKRGILRYCFPCNKRYLRPYEAEILQIRAPSCIPYLHFTRVHHHLSGLPTRATKVESQKHQKFIWGIHCRRDKVYIRGDTATAKYTLIYGARQGTNPGES